MLLEINSDMLSSDDSISCVTFVAPIENISYCNSPYYCKFVYNQVHIICIEQLFFIIYYDTWLIL